MKQSATDKKYAGQPSGLNSARPLHRQDMSVALHKERHRRLCISMGSHTGRDRARRRTLGAGCARRGEHTHFLARSRCSSPPNATSLRSTSPTGETTSERCPACARAPASSTGRRTKFRMCEGDIWFRWKDDGSFTGNMYVRYWLKWTDSENGKWWLSVNKTRPNSR
jgi:hypothetical protein